MTFRNNDEDKVGTKSSKIGKLSSALTTVQEQSGWTQAPRLKQEIDSWRKFAQSLRLEDRKLFRDLISKVWAYADAIENSERGYTTESLLISLILYQQKTINWLGREISRLNKQRQETKEEGSNHSTLS